MSIRMGIISLLLHNRSLKCWEITLEEKNMSSLTSMERRKKLFPLKNIKLFKSKRRKLKNQPRKRRKAALRAKR